MTSIGTVYLVFSLLAIVFGAVTLLLPKGFAAVVALVG